MGEQGERQKVHEGQDDCQVSIVGRQGDSQEGQLSSKYSGETRRKEGQEDCQKSK